MDIERPYLLFIGDVADVLAAKFALGALDWRPDWCVGQMRLPDCKADLGIADMTVAEGVEAGARTFVVGAVNPGGILPETWIAPVVEAIEAGMNVAAGLHVRLETIPAIGEAAAKHGATLHDLRMPPVAFTVGKGVKRSGKRLLAMGTDCSVGKKYAALCLERDMRAEGMKATFRATGQTGVLVSGGGVAIDAVVADFISGAAEWLSPDNDDDHWDVIEGQGSLFHPSFAAVTLGLLHGSQPDAFVVCHEPSRTSMRGVANKLPLIGDVIDATVRMGRLTNPDIRCVGICVNTSKMNEADAVAYLSEVERDYDLPTTDPMRFGTAEIIDRL